MLVVLVLLSNKQILPNMAGGLSVADTTGGFMPPMSASFTYHHIDYCVVVHCDVCTSSCFVKRDACEHTL